MSRFRPINRETDYLLPPSVQDWLPESHLARYVVEVVEGQILHLDERAHQALGPGNVRQLRNVLRTLVALCEDGVIRHAELPAEIRSAPALADACEDASPTPLDDAERSALRAVLESQRWHTTYSAEQLGLSRNTLYPQAA